jgi:hypothetical protein
MLRHAGRGLQQDGRPDDAIQAGRWALDLAVAGHDEELVRNLRAKLARYNESR